MKYYIIAGEASGDLHGSNLILELNKLDAQAHIRSWGGDLMQKAGAHLVKHYKELAFMGFVEVIKNLPVIMANLKFCKQDIEDFQPEVIVLLDYPGFNLRIAKWAKAKGFKVVYYISPQVWAWKESRVKLIRKVVDKMLVILPFEKEFYETRWSYKVEYVGHPLAQVIDDFISKNPDKKNKQELIVALLPGSREQEVAIKLPVMLGATKAFPHCRFIIAKAASIEDAFYNKYCSGFVNVSSVKNDTYNLLNQASAALVTSGTATLETALFGVPQVVCYKGSSVSYHIAKRLVRIKYISLVNLIMNRLVVKELIQNDFTVENLMKELDLLLNNEEKKQRIKKEYEELQNLLQRDGNASQKAALSIFNFTHATV